MIPTVDSYYSGGGLFDIGLQDAGLQIRQSFEIDPVCCETQRLNFNHDIVQCDITKKLVKDDLECDVIIATYPCTKYSTAADISGSRTGDDHFLHVFRHLAIAQPEGYTIENVPGMLKFPVVMEAMTKLPRYFITIFCPVKAEMWLPQKRNRLILMGSKKNFIWQPPASRRAVSLSEILEDNPDVTIPDYVYKRLQGKYRDKPIISNPSTGDIAPTCVAHYAKDQSTRLVVDKRFPHNVRPYTPREYARLQGVPDWFKFAGSKADIYRQVGNGVPVPIGRWVGEQWMRYFN
jgi:DNA (cytosine-5)-methyltransferase 1